MELMVFSDEVYNLIDASSPLIKLDTGYVFVEGPVFYDHSCYFTDFQVDKIYRYTNGKSVLIDDQSHFSIGMTYDRKKNRILKCTREKHAITDLQGNVIIDHYQGIRLNGSNDVIVDSTGRIFFTDPLSRKIEGVQIGHSSVFMFDEEKSEMTLLDSTLTYPNGLALSPDERFLYIADTNANAVYKIDLATKEMECFIKLDQAMGEGRPDGLRLDKEGNLYITGPGGIWLVNPEGQPLGIIKMPEVAANLCFDEKGLFITATGSIYHVDTKIPSAV